MQHTEASITQLPEEILTEILFSSFPEDIIKRFSLVCKAWNEIANSEKDWQKLISWIVPISFTQTPIVEFGLPTVSLLKRRFFQWKRNSYFFLLTTHLCRNVLNPMHAYVSLFPHGFCKYNSTEISNTFRELSEEEEWYGSSSSSRASRVHGAYTKRQIAREARWKLERGSVNSVEKIVFASPILMRCFLTAVLTKYTSSYSNNYSILPCVVATDETGIKQDAKSVSRLPYNVEASGILFQCKVKFQNIKKELGLHRELENVTIEGYLTSIEKTARGYTFAIDAHKVEFDNQVIPKHLNYSEILAPPFSPVGLTYGSEPVEENWVQKRAAEFRSLTVRNHEPRHTRFRIWLIVIFITGVILLWSASRNKQKE